MLAKLFSDSYQFGTYATGTFRVAIPLAIKEIKATLSQRGITHGTGYYWHPALVEESQPQQSLSQKS